MAATIATALKQLIESAGLGLHAYRDQLPVNAKTALPAVVVTDRITVAAVAGGDAGGGDTATENVQVDLWEQYINESDPDNPALAESYNLADQLGAVMHGASLPGPPKTVYGVRVRLVARTSPDREANLVRTRYSVDVLRQLF